MAIAIDAVTDGGYTSGTSKTFSHTCAASTELVVTIRCQNTVTSCTYNGTGMTTAKYFDASAGSGWHYYVFWLASPSTGANNVVITPSASSAMYAGAASFTGLNGTGAGGSSTYPAATTSNLSQTPTVTGGTGVVIDVVGNNTGSWSVGAGQSVIFDADALGNHWGSSYEIHSGTSVAMSWSGASSSADGTAVEIKGPAAPSNHKYMMLRGVG
jgi:hypothetical protein